MDTGIADPGGIASGPSAGPPDDRDDRLISLPGRSPVLDAAQLGVLRRYGSERDVAAGDVLFADGDETYDLIVLLAGTADIIEGYGQPEASVVASYGPSEFLGEIGMLTGRLGRAGHRAPAAGPADRGSAAGRHAQVGGGRRGAPWRSAGSCHVPAASAGRVPGRAGSGGDPGRSRPVRGRHDAVRGGRETPARGAGIGRHAGYPGRRGVLAGAVRDRVRRPLGRGRGRRAVFSGR